MNPRYLTFNPIAGLFLTQCPHVLPDATLHNYAKYVNCRMLYVQTSFNYVFFKITRCFR